MRVLAFRPACGAPCWLSGYCFCMARVQQECCLFAPHAPRPRSDRPASCAIIIVVVAVDVDVAAAVVVVCLFDSVSGTQQRMMPMPMSPVQAFVATTGIACTGCDMTTAGWGCITTTVAGSFALQQPHSAPAPRQSVAMPQPTSNHAGG